MWNLWVQRKKVSCSRPERLWRHYPSAKKLVELQIQIVAKLNRSSQNSIYSHTVLVLKGGVLILSSNIKWSIRILDNHFQTRCRYRGFVDSASFYELTVERVFAWILMCVHTILFTYHLADKVFIESKLQSPPILKCREQSSMMQML